MSYSKPLVTIELDEYNELKNSVALMNDSDQAKLIRIYRQIINTMIGNAGDNAPQLMMNIADLTRQYNADIRFETQVGDMWANENYGIHVTLLKSKQNGSKIS